MKKSFCVGLPHDAFLGNYTWRQHYGEKKLMKHCRGSFVRHLQKDLVSAGYPTKISGIFDLSTQSALMDFQFDHGYSPSGIADLQTKETLIEYCTCQ